MYIGKYVCDDKWDKYFMESAKLTATMATCLRRQVGAVAVRDKRIIVNGYNGSLPSHPHCTDVGCDDSTGHCLRTLHAEQNIVCWAAKQGVSLQDCVVYCTLEPCDRCAKLLEMAGVSVVYYLDEYVKQ